ncbi:MAG: response regulator [Deltaproteobacteria bacterium]|nr:response regulator [Deltaproteobacteria bacterium]
MKAWVYSADPQRLAALQRVLSEAGFLVHGGTQAPLVLAEATAATSGASPERTVVVADSWGTDPSGATVLAALGGQPPAYPVLLLPQKLDDNLAGGLLAGGVADILEQPLTPAALAERARTLCLLSRPPPSQPAALNAWSLRRLWEFVSRTRRSGLLTVDTVGGRAHLMVQQGALGFAQYGGEQGEPAAQRVLGQGEVLAFFWQPVPDDASSVAMAPPQPQAAGASPAFSAVEVVPGAGAPRPPPPTRVLVVDDDTALLEIACKFLQRAGLEVSRADNGQRGLEEALRVRPMAIISDIMMPDVDGWALLRLVRDDHRLREVPFLLLSCHDEYRDKLRQVGAGADAYLAKGIKGDQLMKAVTDCLARHALVWTAAGPGCRLDGRLDHVGPLNLVLALSYQGLTGTLHARDAWTHAVLGFRGGQLVTAGATADITTLTGQDALEAYVRMRGAAFVFDPLQVPPDGPAQDPRAQLDAACERANAHDDEVREKLMLQGEGLNIHPELMALYERVTTGIPPAVLEHLARGSSPGAVMAETGESPLIVEWVVKDMVRKGVAVFRETPRAAGPG